MYEDEMDGMRCFLIRGTQEQAILVSKHNGEYGAKDFPKLFRDLRVQPSTILDCELIRKTEQLYVFDLLNFRGTDTTPMSLAERKEGIPKAIEIGPDAEHVFLLNWIVTDNPARVEQFYNECVQRGLEGAMVKDVSLGYGSPNGWLKLKNFESVDLVIMKPRFTKHTAEAGHTWSWELGAYNDKGELVYVGDSNTFVRDVDPAKVKVGDVVEVRHQPTEGFKDLRNGVILRVRTDKKPEECLTEQLPWLKD